MSSRYLESRQSLSLFHLICSVTGFSASSQRRSLETSDQSVRDLQLTLLTFAVTNTEQGSVESSNTSAISTSSALQSPTIEPQPDQTRPQPVRRSAAPQSSTKQSSTKPLTARVTSSAASTTRSRTRQRPASANLRRSSAPPQQESKSNDSMIAELTGEARQELIIATKQSIGLSKESIKQCQTRIQYLQRRQQSAQKRKDSNLGRFDVDERQQIDEAKRAVEASLQAVEQQRAALQNYADRQTEILKLQARCKLDAKMRSYDEEIFELQKRFLEQQIADVEAKITEQRMQSRLRN